MSSATVGSNTITGLLEVLNPNSGAWGTVCNDYFDSSDAQVACRSLGLSGGTFIYGNSGFTNAASNALPILMDDVSCGGSEAALWQCNFRGWGSHNCGHDKDVVVQCNGGACERAMVWGATSSSSRVFLGSSSCQSEG